MISFWIIKWFHSGVKDRNHFSAFNQGSRSAWFGADIRPHSQCKIVSFFPNFRPKFSQFDSLKKNWKVYREKMIYSRIIIHEIEHQGQNTWFLKALLIVCKIHDVQLTEGNKYMDNKIVFFWSQFVGKHRYFSQFQGPQSQKGVRKPC